MLTWTMVLDELIRRIREEENTEREPSVDSGLMFNIGVGHVIEGWLERQRSRGGLDQSEVDRMIAELTEAYRGLTPSDVFVVRETELERDVKKLKAALEEAIWVGDEDDQGVMLTPSGAMPLRVWAKHEYGIDPHGTTDVDAWFREQEEEEGAIDGG